MFACILAARAVNAANDANGTGPVVGKDAFGQLVVFKLDDAGQLWHRWRKASNGAWSAWSDLGGSLLPGIAIIQSTNGEMEIFGVDRKSRSLEYIRQLTANYLDWSAWTNLGGTLEAPVAAEKDADGRVEVFAVDAATHQASHVWQLAGPGGWSAWAGLGGALQPGVVANKNKDGRLELFGRAIGSNALLHCWQLHPNTTNDWSTWANLGGDILPGFAAGTNALGRMEIFAINRPDNTVTRICQSSPGNSAQWTPWQNFGGEMKFGLAVGECGDGRLEIFGVDAVNSMLRHRWELWVNGSDKWSDWADTGEKSGSTPAVEANEDGDLEVFVTDPADPNTIYHRRQISSSSDWLDWSSLDDPVFGYTCRFWQVDEGLPDNLVQAIAQTTDGFLWVGTRGGLARFDGKEFVAYNAQNTPALKNSAITALCAGSDGALWVGTDGGGLIRLKDGVFSQFSVTNGLAGDEIQVIYESRDGSLWIGTDRGMSRLRNGICKTYTTHDGLLSDAVRSIYEDRSGNLWIATVKGLNRLQANGVMEAFVMPNGLPNDSVRVICQDRGGRIWVGSNDGLLWYNWYWGNNFYAYNSKYGLSDTFVSAICEDRNDNLWVGTYSGLNRFHDGRFYNQPDNDGEPFDKINALFVDREGDVWVGSKEGLACLTAQKFFTYTKQQGLTHNNVMSVLQDPRNNLWIGTWGGGLDEMQGEKITAYTSAPTNGLSQDLILSLCEGRDGSLWSGADFDGGLTRFKDGHITRYTWRDGLADSGLRVLHEDAEGNLWIGSDHGVNCLQDGKVVTNRVTTALADDSIRDICQDKSGALWFATQNGLVHWQDEQLATFTTADGLSDNAITALYPDDENTLWIGTGGGGLNRYQNGRFTAYTTRQGLFSDEISGMVGDRDWLWMSCSRGIFRVRKSDLDAFDRGKIETIASLVYGKNDGMESLQCNSRGKPSIWKSGDGRLWFATSKGLVTVDPKAIETDPEPPTVFIKTVAAGQKIIADGRMELSGAVSVLARRDSPLRIPEGRGELKFEYSALGFSDPEKEHFKYRLEGVDPGWVDAGEQRVAYYNNLPPGNYFFQVKACNRDGVWNEAGAGISVILLPHYWQTLWFQSLGGLMAFSGICGAAFYTTRRRMQRKFALLEQQQAVDKERIRIARDMHDQLGAGLTQIGLLGEFARRDADRNGDTKIHVQKICDTARDLAQTLDEIVWMVNPRNDTLNKLGHYLAAYAEGFLDATPIRCRLDIPPGLPSLHLSAECRHNLFLTVKEALNNIVKHSRATEARLGMQFKVDLKIPVTAHPLVSIREVESGSRWLEIEIEDNGIGFAADAAGGDRNGLKNMSERIREIGGIFELSSRPGKGTRIGIRAPVNEL